MIAANAHRVNGIPISGERNHQPGDGRVVLDVSGEQILLPGWYREINGEFVLAVENHEWSDYLVRGRLCVELSWLATQRAAQIHREDPATRAKYLTVIAVRLRRLWVWNGGPVQHADEAGTAYGLPAEITHLAKYRESDVTVRVVRDSSRAAAQRRRGQ